jgi:mRNA interferase YafQ
MYAVLYTKTFERDVKRCKKRGLDITIISDVVDLLRKEGKLPAQYKPHKLKGDYEGKWECHLKPDWLLIWKQNDSEFTLLFMYTGTHSDLF